ncbi:MAG: MATE family efflux transporter [Bacteroidota bacterium]
MSTPSPSAPGAASIWRDIRFALSGKQYDFTSGSIGRAILILAVPMVLEMSMQAVFEVVDVFFVGRLGADAVTAVGLTGSVLILVFAVGMGLSMAATAIVARRIGEGDPEGASRAAFQVLLVTFVVSLPIAAVGILFPAELLRLMGATESVIEVGSGYFAIMFGGNLSILFLFLINAIFRGAGDAAIAMRVLWVSNLLNIVLDPLLIFGWGPVPALGVTGAAIATTTGRGIAVVYQLWLLNRGHGRIRVTPAAATLNPVLLRTLAKISIPGLLQYFVGTASWLLIFRIMADFGSEAVAGYTIAIRIIVFAILPSWGMANAAATMVGQNLGAKRPDRAERAVSLASVANMVFMGLFAVALQFTAEPILRVFTEEPDVIRYGTQCLIIVSYSYLFLALGIVMVQAFNGAGDTTTPTYINLVSYWILQIPLAYWLAKPLGMGPDGVFWAIAIAQSFLGLLAYVVFGRGSWKTREV